MILHCYFNCDRMKLRNKTQHFSDEFTCIFILVKIHALSHVDLSDVNVLFRSNNGVMCFSCVASLQAAHFLFGGDILIKITCSSCGSNSFNTHNGYRICLFCGTKYRISKSDFNNTESEISLNDDVARLLRLCREQPSNAKKYANLVLDIDPNNSEAYKYL